MVFGALGWLGTCCVVRSPEGLCARWPSAGPGDHFWDSPTTRAYECRDRGQVDRGNDRFETPALRRVAIAALGGSGQDSTRETRNGSPQVGANPNRSGENVKRLVGRCGLDHSVRLSLCATATLRPRCSPGRHSTTSSSKARPTIRLVRNTSRSDRHSAPSAARLRWHAFQWRDA